MKYEARILAIFASLILRTRPRTHQGSQLVIQHWLHGKGQITGMNHQLSYFEKHMQSYPFNALSTGIHIFCMQTQLQVPVSKMLIWNINSDIFQYWTSLSKGSSASIEKNLTNNTRFKWSARWVRKD